MKINKIVIIAAISSLLLAACTQTGNQDSSTVNATTEVKKTDYLTLTRNVQ